MIPATGWTCEVHELSEGFSAIVYDEHGQMLADHLDEDRALLIAAAPDMLAALEAITQVRVQGHDNIWAGTSRCREIAATALAKARGEVA